MSCQKRSLTLSYYVKARHDLVYLGFQQSSRNSNRHTRYTCKEEWLAVMAPACNFLFGYFSCTLLEDMIDVDITILMLKGLHTFRKGWAMQVSKCSLWGMGVKLFPSRKRTKGYIKECQAIANPFTPRCYPSRPIHHHLQSGTKPQQ